MLGERFDEALLLAASLHRTQVRKVSGVPYLSHLLCVAGMVLEYGADEDTAIAALLHDAVEDQGGAPVLQMIRGRFGPRVATIVEGASEVYQVPKPGWRERKERFIAGLREADSSVLLVVLADKFHNCFSMLKEYEECGSGLWSHYKGRKSGTIWYYRAVLKAVAGSKVVADSHALSGLLAVLKDMVEKLERCAMSDVERNDCV